MGITATLALGIGAVRTSARLSNPQYDTLPRQIADRADGTFLATVVVRTSGQPLARYAAQRDLSTDPSEPLMKIETMEYVIADSTGQPRFSLGVLADWLLTAAGIYGVVAYTTTRKAREVGIRVALGASPGSIVAIVLLHAIQCRLKEPSRIPWRVPADKPRLGVLIAQHPAINHAMLLREVRELRKQFDVYTASVRAPDRPPEKLTEEEKDETVRTYFVKPHGIGGALRAHLRTLFSRPADYFGGLVNALLLGGGHPVGAFLYFGYFTQALMVGQWMLRNRISHLHVHYSSTVGLLVKRIFPVGLSISFHGPDEFDNPVSFHLREKVRACEFVRAISQYARSQLMKSSDTADWHKIEVVYMGVDPAAFAPRPFRPNPAPLELICVGRLAPVKAQHILLAALERLVCAGTNVRLHVVGGGPDRNSLEAAAAAREIQDRVVFHGFTLQEKLDQLYRQADIFVLASFAEGVPGVLMEAMSMEIPCVSTWITGVPELIRNGVDGLLVAPSDDEALAGAVGQLAADGQLRLRVGQAARERILDRFHLEKNAAQLGTIFQRFL